MIGRSHVHGFEIAEGVDKRLSTSLHIHQHPVGVVDAGDAQNREPLAMADGAASERGLYHFRIEREVEGLAQILAPAPHNGQAVFEVYTSQHAYEAVLAAVKKAGIEPDQAEVGKYADNTINLEGPKAQQMLKLMEALEDHDDVQNVWANFDIADKELEAAAAG